MYLGSCGGGTKMSKFCQRAWISERVQIRECDTVVPRALLGME
jgi:hypothetical protein